MTKLRLSWPNRITMARILLIVPFVIAMLNINDPAYKPWTRYAALLVFIIMAISDALDGYLARKHKDVTALGTFLDPLADKLLIVTSCLLLSLVPTSVEGMLLPGAVVVIIIGKDLYTVLGFVIVYLVTGAVKIVPARLGKLSTALQLSMVVAILISPEAMRLIRGFDYFVQFLWWAAAASAVGTMLVYTRNGSRYLSEYEHQKRQKAAETGPNKPS
jgi:cardiolipin synthase